MLVGTAEKAMDFIACNRDLTASVNLAAELVELRSRQIVSCPDRVKDYLTESVDRRKNQPMDFDREKIIPYATIYSANSKAKWRAIRIVNNALDAQIHGDKDIDIYQLYGLIDTGLMFNPELYKDKPLRWLSIMLDSLHNEFKTGRYYDAESPRMWSDGSMKIADNEVQNRVAILIGANLWAFEQDQDSFKKRLFDNHRHYIDDLLNNDADYDLATLTAIGVFNNAF